MLRTLDDVLGPMASLFSARDFTLLFADKDGVILDQRAGGGFTDTSRALRLQAGSAWDEATRGTNAIGTALAEEAPVVVHGGAHYATPNANLVCYGVPVRDPWGDLVGVLDATSYAVRADPMAGAAVLAAARAVEEALRMGMLQSMGGTTIERLLARVRDAALLVTPDGRVTHANQAAVRQGLQLGQVVASNADVVRSRARIIDVAGVGLTELEAAAKGQVRLPMTVEPLEAQHGRSAGYLLVFDRPQDSNPRRHTPPIVDTFHGIRGSDPVFMAVKQQARRLADSALPVVILGETGTGKGLFARALHDGSPRANHPFVAINCGAIAPSVLHSELFGHGPGAFTGATAKGRAGRLAAADGGSLFLDELGELSPDAQVALLRFLEDGTYRRVGEEGVRHANVRLIAATCADLQERVASGGFRQDLYYRLCGAVIRLPPLRTRQDLPLLTDALTKAISIETGLRPPTITPGARSAIAAWTWPGNVRELRMALHRAMVLAGAGPIEAWHLPQAETSAIPTPDKAPDAPPTLADAERSAVRNALRIAEGNLSAAARTLGVARSTVYRLMKRHGLGG
ncbi:MAG: sigma-54-dependent Fis family transcriptional regulator [Myxococcota bacterium]